MNIKHTASALALCVSLAACGGGGDSADSTSTSPSSTQSDTTPQQASQSASCPPELDAPAGADGGPTDDILGVDPGMAFSDADQVLRCHNSEFQVAFDENFFASPVGLSIDAREIANYTDFEMCEELDRMISDCQDPVSREHVRLALTGFEGEETVVGIWRFKGWDVGTEPSAQAIVTGLIDKYGEPTLREDLGSRIRMNWAFDLRGRLITDSSYGGPGCHRNISARMSDGSNFSTECGVTIEVYTFPSWENDLLIRELHISSVNQNELYRARESFVEVYTAQEAARMAEEAERASAGTEVDL